MWKAIAREGALERTGPTAPAPCTLLSRQRLPESSEQGTRCTEHVIPFVLQHVHEIIASRVTTSRIAHTRWLHYEADDAISYWPSMGHIGQPVLQFPELLANTSNN